jgi:hypothetical protein
MEAGVLELIRASEARSRLGNQVRRSLHTREVVELR